MRYDLDEILNKAYSDEHAEENIKPSYALNQETISKMREQSNMDKRRIGFRLNKVAKIMVACCCVFAIAGISTMVYSEISKNWRPTISLTNSDGETEQVVVAEDVEFKKIPETALANEGKTLTWEEIEENLGCELLGDGQYGSGLAYYSVTKNDNGNIALADITVSPYKIFSDNYDETADMYTDYVALNVSILNEGIEDQYLLPFLEGRDTSYIMQLTEKYFSQELNTEVILYYADGEKYVNAVFVYDGVYYYLYAENATVEQMKETIEGLK